MVAAAAAATGAGAAMLLYVVLSRRMAMREDGTDGGDPSSKRRRRAGRRPAQAPATWREAAATLAETMRFTYAETLGKWPIGDLAFGIRFLMRRQGDLHIASVFAGSNCVQMTGPGIIDELIHLLRLLTLCMFFSKKPFPVFLELAGYFEGDVLLQEPKAGLLKPAFTIICDKSTKSFLLLIRGTHSIKDTLTAVTGAMVPFHHLVLHEGGISNLVLGYAHCGMVAAARWIAKCTTPCLLKAVNEHPDYKIKIVGHSLGGGTAALLTYILRERREFSSSTCVTFAPAACMTWDLAESGKHFITTVINGSDIVPSFTTSSIDNLRSEVAASSWLNDLRDQIQHTRFLNVVYRSASALGSHLPSISSAKARVAGAGALLRPVSNSTQVVMKRAQHVAQAVVRSRSSLSSWSCMGARRRVVSTLACAESDKPESLLIERIDRETTASELDYSNTLALDHDEAEEEDELIQTDHEASVSMVADMSEGELWFELEKNLQHDEDIQAREEEEAAVKEIMEEETEVLKEAVESRQPMSSDALETQQYYPPGRIMHMVAVPVSSANQDGVANDDESTIGIYETPRDLYSKIRLSPTMINDHYMPMYKKTMELLIEKLRKDGSSEKLGENDICCTSILM